MWSSAKLRGVALGADRICACASECEIDVMRLDNPIVADVVAGDRIQQDKIAPLPARASDNTAGYSQLLRHAFGTSSTARS